MARVEDGPRDGPGQGTRLCHAGRTRASQKRKKNIHANLTRACSQNHHQGYELAEEEVKISLDRFRSEYTNEDGSPKYAISPTSLPSPPLLPSESNPVG